MCLSEDGRDFNNNNHNIDDTKIICSQIDSIDTIVPPTAASTRNPLPPQPKGSKIRTAHAFPHTAGKPSNEPSSQVFTSKSTYFHIGHAYVAA